MPTAPPRRCPNMGCPHTMPCPTHTAARWAGSTRKSRLPRDWAQRRQQVLQAAAHRCQCTGCPRCAGRPCTHQANQVDHRTAGDDHSLDNLQALCQPCHGYKTTMEANAAQRRRVY